MIRKTSILLVTQNALLNDSLETLLLNNARLRYYQATAGDYQDLLPKIHRYGPVTLIVEKEAFGEKLPGLAALLMEYSDLQIIVISSVNNDVQVYSSYQSAMTIADDLLALIRLSPPVENGRRRQTAVFPFAYATLHH